MMSSCPIESIESDSRLTVFPLGRPELFEWSKKAMRCYWTAEEINMATDAVHYKTKLNDAQRHFVKHVLAFFAASDGIVNVNLVERFQKDIEIFEVRYFYAFQVAMENIHALTYSLLLESIIPSREERNNLFNAIKTMPIIAKMSKFMTDCIESDKPFGERLLRMACVEGIFFTGCFAAIYWLQSMGLMPGLAQSNELIARDEAMHTEFAAVLFNMLKGRPPRHIIENIMNEAVNTASEFIRVAVSQDMIGMNADLLIPYIKCQADNLLVLINEAPLYNEPHSLFFMEQINCINKTDFFGRRVSEYSKPIAADPNDAYIEYDF